MSSEMTQEIFNTLVTGLDEISQRGYNPDKIEAVSEDLEEHYPEFLNTYND